MKQNRIAVTATPEQINKAEEFAVQSSLPFITNAENLAAFDLLLLFTPDFIGLQSKKTIFKIDFLAGKMRFRSELAGMKTELLAKAMGQKPKDHPVIIDATAGLGRDSFILASLGFHVTMLERSPVLFMLLKDGMERAARDLKIAPIINRLHLIQVDSNLWLKKLAQKPDIIYLDPMFPERKKSASVKKEMLILQQLLGNEEDPADFLQTALTCTARRVVVKRPRLAPPLAGAAPNFSLKGKSSRFDIYLSKQKI